MGKYLYVLHKNEYISIVSKTLLQVTECLSLGTKTRLYDIVMHNDEKAIVLCNKDEKTVLFDINLKNFTCNEIARLSIGECLSTKFSLSLSHDNRIAVINTTIAIYAINMNNGRIIWSCEFGCSELPRIPEVFYKHTLPILFSNDSVNKAISEAWFVNLDTLSTLKKGTYNAFNLSRWGYNKDDKKLYAIGDVGQGKKNIIMTINPVDGAHQSITETEFHADGKATNWQWTSIGMLTGVCDDNLVYIISRNGEIQKKIATKMNDPYIFFDDNDLFTLGLSSLSAELYRISKYSNILNKERIITEYLDFPDNQEIINVVG